MTGTSDKGSEKVPVTPASSESEKAAAASSGEPGTSTEPVGDLDTYTVTINGIEHEMQLSQEDAERYGDQAKKSSSGSKSSSATSKTHAPQNKGA